MALLRRWKRAFIEVHRAGYKGYDLIRLEVLERSRSAWENRLGESIFDETIANPH
jgi:hypothetical protein